MINALKLKVLHLLAPQMRAPGPGVGGWIAKKLMETGNPPSIIEGISRLDIQPSDVFVELGAGHGVGMRHAFMRKPKRLVAVEISETFRQELETVKQELDHDGVIEIYGEDAIQMPFLENNSVDKMFAMNVIYFLDPLDSYLKEMHRVLKPNASVIFGCKFGSVKGASHPFVNTRKDPIIQAMKKNDFHVSSTKVELGLPIYNYTEIKGVKKG